MDRASGSWSRRERQPRSSVEFKETPYNGIGAELRDARISLGYDIAQVAEALRMRASQVEAIEEGRFGDLPGATYAAGFLRSYARLLGIDPDLVAGAFRDEAQALRAPPKLDFPLPPDEGNRPGLALIAVSLVVAGAIYGAWHSSTSDSRIELTAVSEVPERLAAAVSELMSPDTGEPPAADVAAASSAVPEAAVEPAAGELETTAEGAPDSATVQSGSAPAAVSAAEAGGASPQSTSIADRPPLGAAMAAALPSDDDTDTPPPEPETLALAAPASDGASAPPPLPAVAGKSAAEGYVPRAFGAANKDARVVLKARADSWVQIQGANSELVLTRMLRAGDTYQVPNRNDLVMITGNAGGIIFVVDGKAFPPMGPDGAVRRNIPLSPEELLARVAASH